MKMSSWKLTAGETALLKKAQDPETDNKERPEKLGTVTPSRQVLAVAPVNERAKPWGGVCHAHPGRITPKRKVHTGSVRRDTGRRGCGNRQSGQLHWPDTHSTADEKAVVGGILETRQP